MVEAGAGAEFGGQTQQCLADMGVMVAFCFDNYGEKTGSSYCSFYEVKHANMYKIPIIPLKLYDGPWPPAPKGDKEGTDQNKFVFHPAAVYQQFRPPFNHAEIARFVVDAANKL